MRERRRVLLLVLGGLAASVAFPETLHAAGCTVGSAGVALGSYSVFGSAPANSTGTISYSCAVKTNPPVIKLSRGLASSFNPRTMQTNGDFLRYNLFLEASCVTVWGDGTSGTSVYSAPAPDDGQKHNVTVYGRIPARQNVRSGVYRDSIVITIEF